MGDGLRIAARDSGGMIQAIERMTETFALGVQWHPEHLFYAHRQTLNQKASFAGLLAPVLRNPPPSLDHWGLVAKNTRSRRQLFFCQLVP